MKQQRPATIANGRLVTPDGLREGTLRLVDGMIDAIDASAQDGDETIDANGALVAPGLVDLGVFAIDKPAFHFGGITRAALIPTSPRRSICRAACPTSPRAGSPISGCIRSLPRHAGSMAARSPNWV